MYKYYITTENTCDLPEGMYEQFLMMPLMYTVNGVNYSGKGEDNLSPTEFYEKVRAGAMPTTSLISPETATATFENILKEGYDIIHIGFSSNLSGTCQSMMIAAKELSEKYPARKIAVIDSLSASLGQGMLVYYALEQREKGASFEEVVDFTENLKLKICHYFTVDDLFHLHRGGRVTKTAAIVGQIVKIKPLLHVDNEGRLIPIGKIFTRKLALKWLVDRMEAKYDKSFNSTVFISHGDCENDAKKVAARIEEKMGLRTKIINYIDPVIGTHSGPGTVAVFFVGTSRNENNEA